MPYYNHFRRNQTSSAFVKINKKAGVRLPVVGSFTAITCDLLLPTLVDFHMLNKLFSGNGGKTKLQQQHNSNHSRRSFVITSHSYQSAAWNQTFKPNPQELSRYTSPRPYPAPPSARLALRGRPQLISSPDYQTPPASPSPVPRNSVGSLSFFLLVYGVRFSFSCMSQGRSCMEALQSRATGSC